MNHEPFGVYQLLPYLKRLALFGTCFVVLRTAWDCRVQGLRACRVEDLGLGFENSCGLWCRV